MNIRIMKAPSHKISNTLILLLHIIPFLTTNEAKKLRRVAIIGGGISGTFTAKYLSEYDAQCNIDSMTIFEESPISSNDVIYTKGKDTSYNDKYQGGRVSSVSISNGQIVEVGASIIHNANKYVTNLVKADDTLKMVEPFHSGMVMNDGTTQSISSQVNDVTVKGLGIWNGSHWSLLSTPQSSYSSSILQNAALFLRYNMDLIRLKRTATKALRSFNILYRKLASNESTTFYNTPDELWSSVGLYNYTQQSFDTLMDELGLHTSLDNLPWYRRYLPNQGLLRYELAASMNICNYNQNNKQLNGLVGLISFLPSGGDLYSVEGGNVRIVHSAYKQASSYCKDGIHHIRKRVSSIVVHDDTYFELYDNDQLSLGTFEIVILAAPLPQANITFHQKINDSFEALPIVTTPDQPTPYTKAYTEVITTVVSNAYSLHEYFNTSKDQMPRSICVTDKGKDISGFSCITLLSSGIYKMFTSTKPTLQYLQTLYGVNVTLEYTKAWDGTYGGATPDYYYNNFSHSKTIPFLLYDCKKKTKGPGLYYTNSIEASAAAIEISAIGAKIVSKLVSFRLGLIDKVKVDEEQEL